MRDAGWDARHHVSRFIRQVPAGGDEAASPSVFDSAPHEVTRRLLTSMMGAGDPAAPGDCSACRTRDWGRSGTESRPGDFDMGTVRSLSAPVLRLCALDKG